MRIVKPPNRFETVSHIIDSWEAVRRIYDYEEIAGVLLFKKFFKLEPSAKKIFHFNGSSSRSKGSKGYDNDDEDELLFYQSPKLIRHAKYFIQMIDKALQLLGPDSELLTTMLKQLGQKHVKFGVTSKMYPPMGIALLETVEELLGPRFQCGIPLF